jgi:hypothetical protein
MKTRWTILAVLAALAGPASAETGDATPRLVLKEHRFTPDQVEVPAGRRFKLEVVNADGTADEFESAGLKVERDIAPHGKVVLQLGPLAPGDYAFVGDLHADTAKGVLHAREASASGK